MTTYLDASALICAAGESPQGVALRKHMREASGEAFCVSPLVRLESLVRPLRTGDTERHEIRLALLDACENLPINDRTFDLALHIRAAHGLKTPDALHLATAGQHQCDRMITGDEQMLRAAPGFAVDIAGPL